jgi:hypothetical protein
MTTWKDKRIEAINKIIKANPKSAKAVTEAYMDEYHSIISSEATNKQQYKMEQKVKQRGFYL